MYKNIYIVSQSILLPIMGGMDTAPILPIMGVGYFIE